MSAGAEFSARGVALVELSEALPRINRPTDVADEIDKALVVIRLHGHPLDSFVLHVPPDGLPAAQLASEIWRRSSAEIIEHLKSDGLDIPSALNEMGIAAKTPTACWEGEPDEAPFISVVVATKDRPLELERCLRQLLSLDYPNFEIVIVDNGATSSATEQMVRAQFGAEERVHYFSERRAGTSLGRNRGIQEARGSIIAFTDDDVVVDRNWLRAMSRRFNVAPEADCVTGIVIPATLETKGQWLCEEYDEFEKGYAPATFDLEDNRGDTLLYPYTAGVFGGGNNMAYRRRVFDEGLTFDTNLGPGTPARAAEDLDALLTVILGGGTIVLDPSVITRHFHRSGVDQVKRQVHDYGIGLTALFTKWCFRKPSTIWTIARRLPPAVSAMFNSRSKQNESRSSDYPTDLFRQEIKGLLYGPVAYGFSVMTAKRRR